MDLRRRSLLTGAGGALVGMPSFGAGSRPALPIRAMEFPRDFGAHLDARTEWWYVTGMARAQDKSRDAPPEYGFQVTFFRSLVESTQEMKSSFAAKHLIFAHAAITDIKKGKFWHDQRIARSSNVPATDIASAGLRTTHVELRDWSLKREPGSAETNSSVYRALVATQLFGLDLSLQTSQAVMLQGYEGLSRKGPQASQTSFYYSQPQLSVEGKLSIQGKSQQIQGSAWLDHEWSNEMLHPDAVGWDWIGMNLDNGSALTAFQIRDKSGAALWDGGSLRRAKNSMAKRSDEDRTDAFNRGDVIFQPVKFWKSPKSEARYPVEWQVRTPMGLYTVRALVENQELDSRASTGAIYWEGLSELVDSSHRRIGYGYLEMTGYAQPLRL
ncbi:MAG: carotenoid 1,2-hydratase [Betaproteobacteria bacterium]|nr:carotenoid 1,2-hydratase [Betaproteobacteria bacterium]